VCEKFCVDFADSSVNDPFSWQWIFEGGNPAVSALQNPSNICYSLAGTYDVTLITETAAGSDTLVLPDYITFIPHHQLGNFSKWQRAYQYYRFILQWQFNTVDITGATNQVYTATQSVCTP
jgi:PKD repeat protein